MAVESYWFVNRLNPWFSFFYEFDDESGVKSSFVLIESCYLYNHSNLFKLIYLVITEWRDDKHLVG
jgi:hypothetical protein